MRLATFDIFDTTLIRRCGEPRTVFHLTAHKLWPDNEMLADEFVTLRAQAEAACGAKATVSDFYAYEGMADFPGFTPAMLQKAEMDMESAMLTFNPEMKFEIERLRNDGWTIKFLSDMYLPSEFLTKILAREGCLKGDEEVIVSCEWNARKDNGTLYKAVNDMYRPTKWCHYGDNRHSDFKMAKRYGVKAKLVQSSYTPAEHRMACEGSKIRNGWRASLLAGASRCARIKLGNSAKTVLAADYVAALYVPFVVWILRSARQQGIERLHFLSRDGYIMKEIAQVLSSDSIELNYLFVSRKALMQAYLQDNSAERFVEISDRKSLIMQRVSGLLERLQLSRKELKSSFGINFSFEKIQTQAQQKEFLETIFNHPEFTENWLKTIEPEATLTKNYLEQEGLIQPIKQAMVDIGWLGTSRLMVNGILGTNISTFYLGVRSDVYARTCGDYMSYFTVGHLDTTATALIENYFSASPWPSTLGYIQDSDKEIKPRFAIGQKFCMNSIVKANVEACREVALMLKPYLEILDDDIMYRWAKMSIDGLVNLTDKTNLTPLTENDDFDGTVMACKLSLSQIATLAFAGKRHTAFDRASVALTLPETFARPIWSMHQRSARLRERIYRGILKLKNR